MRPAGGIAVVLLSAAACAPTPNEMPTLCQLVAHRGAYAGRELTVEGYLHVSRHGSWIEDPACERGFAITWADDASDLSALNRAADEAAEAVFTGEPTRRVRLTGVVKWERSRELRNAIRWYLDVVNARVLNDLADQSPARG